MSHLLYMFTGASLGFLMGLTVGFSKGRSSERKRAVTLG